MPQGILRQQRISGQPILGRMALVPSTVGTQYPDSLPIMIESSTQRLSGIEPARASNGALKIRRFAPGEKMVFNLVHWLGDAQRATLEAFYAANSGAAVQFQWPAGPSTHTVRFGDAPQYTRKVGYWVAQVQLLET